ncbi:MAG: 2-(3-amino-3-carboxypropyl)histidine synthase subunit [Nanoarchaeota archaeon]|nr:2-(3-amino-3-carboxypropyl)histidine synthase subunit [Nanoarchaeota archaeon]MBU0962723.1 2-(3-amino-3-carboxypropyl)histidine synthase subunit [Nanoarchaeota archaeon]
MKTLFIPARSIIDIEKSLKKVSIKGKIGLITTIQFFNQLDKASKLIENSVIGGQVLGCNVKNAEKIKDKVDSFLYIGSGRFHPIQIAKKLKKPVYILNPNTDEFSKIEESEIQDYEKRLKGKLSKFFAAKSYGILVSTKNGQYNLKKAELLRKKLKNSYIFICNNINENEFENFRNIDIWINTACTRIEGKNIINLEDLPEL